MASFVSTTTTTTTTNTTKHQNQQYNFRFRSINFKAPRAQMPPRYPPPKKGQFPPGFIMPILPDLAPVVLCAPSGGGKTSLTNRLVNQFPLLVAHSVSHTTRDPRSTEVNGIDYHFVSQSTMTNIVRSGQLLEYTVFAGNTYGTTRKAVDDILQSAKICLLTLDIYGCDAVKRAYKGARCVFIMPPTKEDLEKRILSRQGASGDLRERLERADMEMSYAQQPGKFDVILVNDNFEACYEQLVKCLDDLIQLAKKKQDQLEITNRVLAAKERRMEKARRRQSPVMEADLTTGVLTSSTHPH